MTITLSVLSYLLIALTFIPLIKDNYWIFRTLEYPRFQKFLIVILLLAGWLALYIVEGHSDLIATGLLLVSAIYLVVKMFPYTVFAKKEILTVKSNDPDNALKIFTANVYQDNRDYDRIKEQIRQTDPDIIFLLETDEAWKNAMQVLKKDYKHFLEKPIENTYGLLFYSRYIISDADVKFLVKSDIPSIEAKLHLNSGQVIQLYGLHPEPPVPGESLRSTAKDKELMKIAFKAKECTIPCIVLGDLNDVAWSYTTSLFTKVSRLLDVRCGRGFYSTFSAKSKFMRFPLDYIFCSEHFGLFSMRRMPFNGSDHFPIFTHLVFRKDLQARQGKTEKADKEEENDASEMASKPV